MIEQILEVIFTEYGVFATFLVAVIGVQGYVIKVLWDRNKYLGDKLVDVIENNVKVLTILDERISNAAPKEDNSR